MISLRTVSLLVMALLAIFSSSIVAAGQQNHYTKDRLTPDTMENLVAEPMELVRRGDFAGGERAFEQLLARETANHGAGSIEAANLLTSFGVLVYTKGLDEKDDELRGKSLPYLERSIAAYRAAFGPDHPAVAVALNSYADAEIQIHRDNPSIKADQALEEAYRIRVASLGPTHPETLSALSALAQLRGHPSQTGKNPTKVREAAALFDKVIAGLPSGTDPELFENRTTARFARAIMYVRNDLIADALAAASHATKAAEEEGSAATCVAAIHSQTLADIMKKEGFAAEASQLLAGHEGAAIECMIDLAAEQGTDQ